jgi:hypothetical protein
MSLRFVTLIGAGLGLALPACTSSNAPAGACYLDEHCPSGMACVDGLCGEPLQDTGTVMEESSGGGDMKLDVAGGNTQVPTTCAGAEAVRTTAGCEFWAVDLPNAWLASTPFSYDIAANQQFAAVVANTSEDQSAEVVVYAGGSGEVVAQATVPPLSAHTFDLPSASIDPTENGGGEAYRIESDVPITAYQFQPLDNIVPAYSNDASALLPAHVLENDYIAVTGNGLQLTMYPFESWELETYNAGAFVTVVATADDTHVQFYPTASLTGGAWEGVVLQRGQTFTILSEVLAVESNGNLSGTRVITDQPVAVFSGSVASVEPTTATECCADHQEHQLLPVVAWGHEYVVAPAPDARGVAGDDPSVIRIVGAFDGTTLTYPAGRPEGAPDTIGAHEMVELVTSQPFTVVSDAEHPILVAQFLLSGGHANEDSDQGDPGLVVLPSVAQLQERYVFLTPTGYATNVVTIAAPSGTEVMVDGLAVDDWSTLGELAGTTWVYGRAWLEPGAHVLSADAPVGITVVGYDVNVSYAYSGGSAVEVISEAPPIP